MAITQPSPDPIPSVARPDQEGGNRRGGPSAHLRGRLTPLRVAVVGVPGNAALGLRTGLRTQGTNVQLHFHDGPEQLDQLDVEELAALDVVVVEREKVGEVVLVQQDLRRAGLDVPVIGCCDAGHDDEHGTLATRLSAVVVRSPSAYRHAVPALLPQVHALHRERRRRREGELAHLETRAHLEGFLRHSPVAMFSKDEEGRYLLVNDEFERAFGVDRAWLRGRTDAELFPPEVAKRGAALERRTREHGVSCESEETLLGEDGERRWRFVRFPLLDHRGTTSVAGVALDLTPRDAEERNKER
ncbi:MAG: PAS domain-containing protein [Acidobacteriota bacterium]